MPHAARRPTSVTAALAVAVLTLTSIFATIYTLGLPQLDYWHWRGSADSYLNPQPNSQNVFDSLVRPSASHQDYLVGAAKADITGPVAEINLMGYADPNQLGSGLRQRLYSRAFIFGQLDSPRHRFVYLVLDTQSGDTAVRNGILEGLAALGPEYQVYGNQNVAVTGTHSHSGPGAWLNYLLPQITSRGFSHQSYQAIVDGALESIKQAHDSLTPGHISFGTIDIQDANINRSPYAYLANPPEERARYKHNVDKTLTLLKLRRNSDDKDIAVLTWFPVHGTSMLGNNTLITGDNKGVAAYLFEKHAALNLNSTADNFIAGFSQANVGDTSPNVAGAYCESGPDEGKQCDFKTSLCAGKNGPCHGRGPHWGLDDAGTASAWEIGRRQYLGALSLYNSMLAETSTTTPIQGNVVRSLHTFVDMSNQTVLLRNGSYAHTCPAAMGYSFAAGTTDGPGAFDFKQNNPGNPNASPVWKVVGNRLHTPDAEQIACQAPKPILLDVGETESPYLWTPNVVDVQLLRLGQLVMIVAPGEATTMAGRRWKDALSKEASVAWNDSTTAPLVVLGGPANTYAHYIATEEEYGVQRYEGASTLYGPHTLTAYISLTLERLPYLSATSKVLQEPPSTPPVNPLLPLLSAGPRPPIHTNISLSFISPVLFDRPPFFKAFGDVVLDVLPRYRLSDSTPVVVQASFVAANPRNNLRLGDTFAAVEKVDEETREWKIFRDDGDWSLLFEWRRSSTTVATSEVLVSWELGWEIGVWGRNDDGEQKGQDEMEVELQKRQEEREKVMQELKGRYRLRYFGDGKGISGGISRFEGTSGEFELY
jgi:neutral ceramidase